MGTLSPTSMWAETRSRIDGPLALSGEDARDYFRGANHNPPSGGNVNSTEVCRP